MNYGAGTLSQERQGNMNAPREISALPKVLQAMEVLDKEIMALDEYVSRLEQKLAPLCQPSPTTGAKDTPMQPASQFTNDVYHKSERVRSIRCRIGELLETVDL